MPLLMPLPVRDGVKYNAAIGTSVGHPLMWCQVCQLVFIQLTLKP